MIKLTLNIRGHNVYFASETCLVTAERSWTETKYVGKIFGTRVNQHHQIWIREPSGHEHFADFEERAGPIKPGDTVTAVWASLADGAQAPLVFINQSSIQASCWAYPVKSEIMQAMRLPFKMGAGADEVIQAVYQIRNEERQRYSSV